MYSGFNYGYNFGESIEFILDQQAVVRKQPLKCGCGNKKEERKSGPFSNLSYDSNESEQRGSITDNDNDLFQKFEVLMNY